MRVRPQMSPDVRTVHAEAGNQFCSWLVVALLDTIFDIYLLHVLSALVLMTALFQPVESQHFCRSTDDLTTLSIM